MESKHSRKAICSLCQRVFSLGKRGPISNFCQDCRPEALKRRYEGRYEGRYYIPHPRPPHPRKLSYQELAFATNGKQCQRCGTQSKKLYVHHKDEKGKSKTLYPDNSLDNLQVLCARCHMKAHNIGVIPNLTKLQEMRSHGLTLEAIGEYFGVSRQRIHQLIKNNSA